MNVTGDISAEKTLIKFRYQVESAGSTNDCHTTRSSVQAFISAEEPRPVSRRI